MRDQIKKLDVLCMVLIPALLYSQLSFHVFVLNSSNLTYRRCLTYTSNTLKMFMKPQLIMITYLEFIAYLAIYITALVYHITISQTHSKFWNDILTGNCTERTRNIY